MARQGINTGTSPNSGTGDTLLEGGVKINDNFIELYDLCGNGNVLAPGIVTSILAGDGISVDQTTGQVTVTASVASTDNVAAGGLFVTGISTLGTNNGIGTVTIGVGNTALLVDGNARVIGILTVGRDSIRIDGDNNQIHVGSGVTLMATGEAEYTGMVTASGGFEGPSAVYSGITTINEEGLQVTGITTLSGNVTLGVTTSQAVTVNSAIKGNLNPSANQTFNLGTVGFKWNNLWANFARLTTTQVGNKIFMNDSGDTGVITATSFVGDGSQLTGVTAVGSGVEIEDSGTTVGVAGTINFGSNLSVTDVSAGIVTVNASGGGSGVSTENVRTDTLTVVGVSTLNGNTNVGVDTNNTLTINAFVNSNLIPNANQTFNLGNTNNKWNNLVANNGTLTQLTLGNGKVRINNSNTGIITARGYELVNASSVGIITASSGGVSVVGVVTATNFVGDGSALTGITATGSGVIVQDSGSVIGTAGTINFAANLSVTPVSLGIVTVTGSAGGGSTDNIITGTAATFTDGITVTGSGVTIHNQGIDVTGVVTATSFVGSLTGAATAAATAVSIPITNVTANAERVLVIGGGTPLASGVPAGLVANNNLAYNPNTAHLKVGTGFSVFGSTGVVTATAFVGDGSGLTNLPSSGYTTSRFVASGTQNSLAVGSTTNLDIAGFDSYALLKVGISSAAWVRLYTDEVSRTNDATRNFTTDPDPNSGVIAEVRTTSAGVSTFRISPGVIGYNDATSIGSTIFTAVVNNEASVTNLTVDLTIINLEP
jgi:hypothetical protein